MFGSGMNFGLGEEIDALRDMVQRWSPEGSSLIDSSLLDVYTREPLKPFSVMDEIAAKEALAVHAPAAAAADSEGSGSYSAVAKTAATNKGSQAPIAPEQTLQHGRDLIGRRIKIYWEGDDEWYAGRIKSFFYGWYTIAYDDGDRERTRLKLSRQHLDWELLPEEAEVRTGPVLCAGGQLGHGGYGRGGGASVCVGRA